MASSTSEQALVGILYTVYNIEELLRRQQGQKLQITNAETNSTTAEGEDDNRTTQGALERTPSKLLLMGMSPRLQPCELVAEDPGQDKVEMRKPETDIEKLPLYRMVVGGGLKIRADGRLPLPFSREYLEWLPLDDATYILEKIKKYMSQIPEAEKKNRDPVKIDILDYNLGSNLAGATDEEATKDIPVYVDSAEGQECLVRYFLPESLGKQPREAAPWARIVICEGLSHYSTDKSETRPNKLCFPIFGRFYDFPPAATLPPLVDKTFIYTGLQVQEMFLLHMLCSKRDRFNRVPTEQSVKSRPLIHATFFMMTTRNPDHGLSSKHASVYRREKLKARFRQACVTVLISEKSSKKRDGSASDFTILILAPPEFYGDYTLWLRKPGPKALIQRLKYSSSGTSPFNDFVDAKTQIVVQIYDLIEHHCKALYKHVLHQCDNTEADISFLDGDEYVDLLYDDTAFRKPSIYAWAVVCLGSLDQNIGHLLSELFLFRSEIAEHNNNRDLRTRQYYDCAMKSSEFVPFDIFVNSRGEEIKNRALCYAGNQIGGIDQIIQRLRVVQAQVQQKRDEFKAMRDGLFSANSVIEARRSRILAEHVRLLTFVSIFFAPLAFCVSLWSLPVISDAHKDAATPICVTAVISVGTYFVVFNLKLLISTFRPFFDGPRNFFLQAMIEEQDEVNRGARTGKSKKSRVDWSKKAKELEVFPKKDSYPQPSEWWFLIFVLYILWRKISVLSSTLWQRMKQWIRLKFEGNGKDKDPECGNDFREQGANMSSSSNTINMTGM